MIPLKTVLKDIQQLKPIPAVVNQLLSAVEKPDSSMEEIAAVIQYDPVITANILKTCNSAYFGLKNPVESIKDAVNYLGIDQIVELALVKSGSQTLSGSQKGYGLEKGGLWRYSVSSAIVARQVAVRLELKDKSTIFTSALIKDIGKIVLEKYVAKTYDEIKELVRKKELSFLEAEKQVLGIDHAELGALIAKTWKFSARMTKIIRHHHLLDESMAANTDIAAVYLADCICMMMGDGVGSDGLSYRFREQAMENLGLTADDLIMIIAEFGVNMDEVETLLGKT